MSSYCFLSKVGVRSIFPIFNWMLVDNNRNVISFSFWLNWISIQVGLEVPFQATKLICNLLIWLKIWTQIVEKRSRFSKIFFHFITIMELLEAEWFSSGGTWFNKLILKSMICQTPQRGLLRRGSLQILVHGSSLKRNWYKLSSSYLMIWIVYSRLTHFGSLVKAFMLR